MKIIINTLLILTCFTLFSQSRRLELKWENKQVEQALSLDDFDVAKIDKNLTFENVNNKLIYSVLETNIPPGFKNNVRILQVTYEDLDANLVSEAKKKLYQEELNMQIKTANVNHIAQSYVYFSPILYSNGVLKRVKSISYVVENQSSLPIQKQSDRNSGRNFISNTVLKQGSWFKFGVTKTGIYKLDRSFLNQLGVPQTIDPRTIQIYGTGGKMLPLLNQANYPTDLQENSIYVHGEAKGTFNAEDYILFYAVGVDQWNEESLTYKNLYVDEGVYFLTYGQQQGLRISNFVEPSASEVTTITTFDGRVFHEQELVNIGKLGRKWFGEEFGIVNNRSFSLELLHLKASEPVTFGVNTASSSYGNTSFSYSINNRFVGAVSFFPIRSATTKGYESFFEKEEYFNTPAVEVTLTYQNGGVPNSKGYLDYIEFLYTGNLIGGSKQYRFSNKNARTTTGIIRWSLSNTNQVHRIWNVADVSAISTLAVGNQSQFSFKTHGGAEQLFQVEIPTDYYAPTLLLNNRVRNQDLKGTVQAQGLVDYLIITNEAFASAAQQLAQFHRQNNSLNPLVVTVEQIYNEFSSGQQDGVAIRNFVRYVYENMQQKGGALKYLNLFGTGSYDYKQRIEQNANIVPLHYGMSKLKKAQNSNSNFSMYTTFMSDDFYGLLDEGEGDMYNLVFGIDVTVGRMLAKNAEEANQAVQKIIAYHGEQARGRWKNNLVAMADDVDKSSDYVLQEETDTIVTRILSHNPFFNAKKIYLDAYVQETSAGGNRYPQARLDFLDAIEKGALFVNYLGHGGEDGLAQERVFTLEDARKLTNENKYPVFSIITCEFSRFDDPNYTSGGEVLFNNSKGGAIALIGTTREIGIDIGRLLNRTFTDLFFENATTYTMADALRHTKNTYTNRDKNVVSYIGDPALKIALPHLKVVLSQVNDEEVTQTVNNPVKALDYVKMKGEIQDESNQLIQSFTGNLAVEIYDKYLDKKTLGNDNVINNGVPWVMDYQTLGEVVFRGNASVKKGAFSFDFIMPKDIRLNEGKGKVSFYSSNQQIEYTGNNDDLVIGGLNENAPTDITPPIARLYLDNESFVSGGATSNNPVFLAFVEDESGINTASGIGHDIVIVVDDKDDQAVVLNDYYETELDNFRKGKVTYQLNELEPGMHTIQFKVWDVYNNLSTTEIQFLVKQDEALKIEKVLNYPNPFVNYTEFWFTHNRPLEPLDVQVQIMTITGRIVKTMNQQITTEGNLSREIQWDGRDDFGDRIGKGVYIYRLTVRSSQTGKKVEKIEKLVIL
ncbi:type IX secretion system sortase PorU [Myroides fluvii]|uniref:type IX secretion system sortase PorU n=1 Tax=Myroides fluvii TaxID=2572594 RepID=UPI001E3A470F|nr:type IX secretion system sortase PorU [Myroides fluvii]